MLSEALGGIATIRSNGSMDYFKQKFEVAHDGLAWVEDDLAPIATVGSEDPILPQQVVFRVLIFGITKTLNLSLA